ncbi:ADP-ribose pyrophosphatase [Sinobacterium norvegicum]|uniref:GDP-mannose pyrophosphatase n=1 Tax=Sinobacterium norvegicum TaxID=1641715 RepID=A0ABM9AD00_9GAMM|nr:NUDIX hydrolase [Sinobacterium norvegicum]CAH0991078.1 ADP-ribose pyrophosphatase [Sinobacterium norvegicum]
MEKFGPWQRISRDKVYDNQWITIYHDEVVTPGGSEGVYGIVSFKNIAIGIIPLDDNGHSWLVSQYRYALGRREYEIPMGGSPEGEDFLLAGQRELREECGIRAEKWTPLLQLNTTNSVSDELGQVFVAEQLSFGQQQLEDSEADLQLHKLPFKTIYQWVLDGKIMDSISVAAVLKLGALRPALLV